MKKTYILAHAAARAGAIQAIKEAPAGYFVQISEPSRTLEQNAAQWPYLQGFSEQKQLCINGVMQWASADDWKDVLTACFAGEMRMASFDNRLIMMPQRTSKMGKRVFSDWMEFLTSMAAQSGVTPVYQNKLCDA